MELELTQKQTQLPSPQLIQAAAILQMGIQELRDYIDQAILENPVLEIPEAAAYEPPAPEPSETQITWKDLTDRQNVHYARQDAEDAGLDPFATHGHYLDESEDLKRYILSQFLGTALEPQVMDALRALVDHLDDGGFLSEDLETLAREARCPLPVMERALTELQAADPAGVGARDLAECLRLQIDRWAGDHSLAVAIVEGHLEDLAKGRYHRIAHLLGVEDEEVRDASAFIRALNPRPAAGFASPRALPYVIPDVEVTCLPDRLDILLNRAFIPRLSLNPDYLKLLSETQDDEVRQYLDENLKKARWVTKSVEQRQDTLSRCVRFMAEYQEGFFRRGQEYLLPLTMEQAAQHLGVHVSTVSRAVREKYLKCEQGVYPLSYLFSRSLGSPSVSTDAVKAQLKKLIDEEDKPLSDQKLRDALARQGFALSRRTVAKYRDELGIPPASARKTTG